MLFSTLLAGVLALASSAWSSPLAPRGTNLRIMPFGDSITFGVAGSTTGNGYRQDLLNLLTKAGDKVHYIGSQKSGTMVQNSTMGFPGQRIGYLMNKTAYIGEHHPNLILLMIGTNDVNQDFHLDTAPKRLGALVDKIFQEYNETTLIVAQITPTQNATLNAWAETYNKGVAEVVSSRQASHHIALVDMYSAVPVADLANKLHPNDAGYALMADTWAKGIAEVIQKGWVAPLA